MTVHMDSHRLIFPSNNTLCFTCERIFVLNSFFPFEGRNSHATFCFPESYHHTVYLIIMNEDRAVRVIRLLCAVDFLKESNNAMLIKSFIRHLYQDYNTKC